ncbi:hypothetical protein [Brevundimonas sp.]|uniref:hypothetical protein n=1 Tax=Brevundimonas sp. TaxID=1871086 RepID=UPI002FCA2C6A
MQLIRIDAAIPERDQMPNITIVADPAFLNALVRQQDLPLTGAEISQGSHGESERLGFELGGVEQLIGYIAAGVEAIVIARHLIEASRKAKTARLEVTSPTGRVSLDLTGKTEAEVAEAVRSVLPFTR